MKKHIITAGCSFTNCGKSWPYHIKEYNVYNVGTVGAGNGYISRAAIWECENLLKKGIPPEEISLIIMWSGIDRFEVLSSSNNPLHKDYISGDKNRWWLSNYNHFIKEEDSVWLKSSIPDMDWENKAVVNLMSQYWKYFYTEEESFLKTLEYILRVQRYCKSKNIKYKMSCWQNIFNQYSFKVPNGYAYQGHDMKHDLWTMVWLDGGHWEPDRFWPKEITQKVSKDTPLLKDVYPQTTELWDMIDFNENWWFYEDNQVELGGLAEWVMLGAKHNMGMQHDPAHPSEYSHKEFAEKEVSKWIS